MTHLRRTHSFLEISALPSRIAICFKAEKQIISLKGQCDKFGPMASFAAIIKIQSKLASLSNLATYAASSMTSILRVGIRAMLRVHARRPKEAGCPGKSRGVGARNIQVNILLLPFNVYVTLGTLCHLTETWCLL